MASNEGQMLDLDEMDKKFEGKQIGLGLPIANGYAEERKKTKEIEKCCQELLRAELVPNEDTSAKYAQLKDKTLGGHYTEKEVLKIALGIQKEDLLSRRRSMGKFLKLLAKDELNAEEIDALVSRNLLYIWRALVRAWGLMNASYLDNWTKNKRYERQ